MSPQLPCRVVVVDDHALVRESISLALEHSRGIAVVGTAGSPAEALTVIEHTEPHVALVDYALDGITGVDLAKDLHERHPALRTVILTASDSAQVAAEAVAAGCAGFVHKHSDLADLAAGLRRVHEGDALFDSQTLASAINWLNRPPPPAVDLTEREAEVLQFLAEGHSTLEISDALGLSHHTVRNHVRNILTKLDARSQLEAVVIGASAGVVEVGRGR